MKKLLMAVVAIAALYHFKPDLFPDFGGGVASAFDEAGNPKVVVFTFTGCGAPCEDAIKLLTDKGVSYDNVDVSQSKENEQLFRRMGGGSSMPLTFVGDTRVDGYDRTKLTHALAQAYGLEYLDWAQREAIQTHFDADGTPKVVMYATDWCPYCTKAREYFTEEGIPFTEIDVEKSAEGERHYKALQASGYPLIYVGVQRIPGFNKKAIKQEVDAL